jgi:hypothetical protein
MTSNSNMTSLFQINKINIVEISDVVGPSPVHITLCNKKGKEDISRLLNLIIQGLNNKK